MHISVDIRRLPGIKKLAADYAFQFQLLAPFYSGDPTSRDAWASAIARAQQHQRRRADLGDLVTSQLDKRQAPAAARAAAARLRDDRSIAIVTGQQAGLFGGPLYTLYKAISAVKLAQKISEEHQVPAVPIFWVESEDHDWNEVASVSVLDAEFQRKTITLPMPDGAGQTPVARVQIGPHIDGVLAALTSTLPQTEFTSPLIDDLRAIYRADTTMSTAFAGWLDRQLGDLGLVVFDCAEPSAKSLVGDIFIRELSTAGRTWALAHEAGQELVARGYHAQVDGSAQSGPALWRLDGTRSPIDASEAASLVQQARIHPEAFSPNVLLRPIVEDALFPTACYVSGPNELAYLGQLKKVYEHFSVPMPLVFPRASVTVVDAATGRFLGKNGLPFDALHAQDESALNRVLAASLPQAVDQALKDADKTIEEKMAAVIAAVPAVDATLEGAAKSTLGKLQHDLAALRQKVISAAKKRDETLRRQFIRARAQAFPDGVPQERALGSIALLNRYGPALVPSLVEHVALDPGYKVVLTL